MPHTVAHAEVAVDASPAVVWSARTDPSHVKTWMVGTEVVTDWKVGSPITWRGGMNGRPYEDTGEVLKFDAPRRLSMTHYSQLMRQPDEPESYHTVTYDLSPTRDGRTKVAVEQDGNESAEQAEQSSGTWKEMLEALKKSVESA